MCLNFICLSVSRLRMFLKGTDPDMNVFIIILFFLKGAFKYPQVNNSIYHGHGWFLMAGSVLGLVSFLAKYQHYLRSDTTRSLLEHFTPLPSVLSAKRTKHGNVSSVVWLILGGLMRLISIYLLLVKKTQSNNCTLWSYLLEQSNSWYQQFLFCCCYMEILIQY